MIRCRSCGAVHPPNTLFCDECGSRMSEAKRVDTDPLPDEPAQPGTTNTSLKISLSTPDNVKQFECVLNNELLIGRRDPATASFPEVDLSQLQGMTQGV